MKLATAAQPSRHITRNAITESASSSLVVMLGTLPSALKTTSEKSSSLAKCRCGYDGSHQDIPNNGASVSGILSSLFAVNPIKAVKNGLGIRKRSRRGPKWYVCCCTGQTETTFAGIEAPTTATPKSGVGCRSPTITNQVSSLDSQTSQLASSGTAHTSADKEDPRPPAREQSSSTTAAGGGSTEDKNPSVQRTSLSIHLQENTKDAEVVSTSVGTEPLQAKLTADIAVDCSCPNDSRQEAQLTDNAADALQRSYSGEVSVSRDEGAQALLERSCTSLTKVLGSASTDSENSSAQQYSLGTSFTELGAVLPSSASSRQLATPEVLESPTSGVETNLLSGSSVMASLSGHEGSIVSIVSADTGNALLSTASSNVGSYPRAVSSIAKSIQHEAVPAGTETSVLEAALSGSEKTSLSGSSGTGFTSAYETEMPLQGEPAGGDADLMSAPLARVQACYDAIVSASLTSEKPIAATVSPSPRSEVHSATRRNSNSRSRIPVACARTQGKAPSSMMCGSGCSTPRLVSQSGSTASTLSRAPSTLSRASSTLSRAPSTLSRAPSTLSTASSRLSRASSRNSSQIPVARWNNSATGRSREQSPNPSSDMPSCFQRRCSLRSVVPSMEDKFEATTLRRNQMAFEQPSNYSPYKCTKHVSSVAK